ncbi:LacI family DNA-binding transcriptional regulator [Streptomyces triticirhizae]|uniref:LacI family transcriptional regulator n=1 Tax=Streptomyces triticirhizae TaxID=2483353 RepID=A0A3M2LI29_9ACTN|nr:LacI family DNA-binding transcriptional regulator [Streptomyces triticirhizae]RMI37114.1 LacI family transcriptional regulator [Streptomyces triticirhizae]
MDVAALAGVSKSAVSKVFNNRDGISPATRERILNAAEKLGWSPSAHAMALRGERTRTVGLVIARGPDLLTADPFFAETVAGLEQELGPAGYGLRLHLIADDQTELAVYEQLVRERRVDAFLLTDHRVGDARHALLRRLGVPALLIGRPWRGEPTACVHALELEEAMGAAVTHLTELGHRRIAYVAGPEDRVHSRLRRLQIERTLADHDLRLRTVFDTELSGEGAARVTAELMADPERRPTAILFANDAMALTGIATAQRMGLRVPEDLSVVGHDDHPLGQWLHPRLTTVTQDARQVSRAAAVRLLRLLGEPVENEPEPPTARLVVRESTGPAPERPA